ncbi:MAG TPA: alpha/beta hydrolase, partial [Aquella sp.]|nr:alpha/beta hydrolase [Aquella sp.]
DVFDFCQALNIEKPIVGGISFGGYIALSYLTQFPSHPLGIILTDTEANSSRERYLNRVRDRLIEKGIDPNELVNIADKVFSKDFSLDLLGPYFNNIIQMFGRPVTQIDNFGYTTTQRLDLSQHFGEHEMFNFDFRDKLKNVNCPILYFVPDDAPLHTLENAMDLVAVYPKEKMQFEVFKNASSPTYDYDPIRAETFIRTFIKSLSNTRK